MCSSSGTTDQSVMLYATQGGGYAIFQDGAYVWHSEIPDFLPDAKVGDPIPEEWDLACTGQEVPLPEESDAIPTEEEARLMEEEELSSMEEDFPEEESQEDDTAMVYHRISRWAGGNRELAREARELYPGDFL